MLLQKELIDGIEVIYSSQDIDYEKIIVLVPGGGKVVGASRFNTLQKDLFEAGIGSISINFNGVEGSSGILEEDNLCARFLTTIKIIDWIKQKFKFKTLSLYGVSMGSPIVLMVQNEIQCNGKIIIHTPAAYAKEVLKVNFNEEFTNILRTPNSWENSESFDLLNQISNPVLLIIHSDDEVIPKEIIERYEQILLQKDNARVIKINNAQHSIWTNNDSDKKFKDEITREIIDFI